jgi:hypothetical protein
VEEDSAVDLAVAAAVRLAVVGRPEVGNVSLKFEFIRRKISK